MSMESWMQRQERIEQNHCPAKAPDCFGDYGSSPIEDLLKKNIEYTKEMRNMIDKVQIKANHDQPEPIKNDHPAIWHIVIMDMLNRDHVGRERYKTPLQPHNGRDALSDAYQEALDLAVYLRQAIYERDGK